METKSLVGIDRVLVRLYRALGFRRYLNETMQTDSVDLNMTADNITMAYQHLQLYNNYDGSYSFLSDQTTRYSSLYLTSLTFGAMISPMMSFRRRLFDGEQSLMMHAQRYLESHVSAVKPHLLSITLFEMAFMQNRHIKLELRQKIPKALLSRKLTVMSEDNSKHLKKVDEKMTFDDQLLLNSMTIAFYTYFGDYRIEQPWI